MPISGPYCFNYRIVIGHLGTNTIQQLNLSMAINCMHCANYRVAVGLLVGQGWERKRPTLSKRYSPPYNAVGVGLFPIG